MKTIPTNLTTTNYTATRGQQILDLIHQYVPGFVGYYFGFRPIGNNDVSFPAVFVEPISQDARMITTGKFQINITYEIYFYAIDNNPADVTTLITSAAENLLKLFSNNALDDIGSGNTNKFKANPGYWLDSEMVPVQISAVFMNATPNNKGGNSFMRAGMMRFVIEDVLIK